MHPSRFDVYTTIGNKAMVSSLAPATLCAQIDPKFAISWAVIWAITS